MKLTKLEAEILNLGDDLRELEDIQADLRTKLFEISVKDEMLKQLLLQKTQADLILIDRIYLMLLEKQTELIDEYKKDN